MSHHILKNLLQTPPVLCLYNFTGMAVRAGSRGQAIAGKTPTTRAGRRNTRVTKQAECHTGPDWLQNQGALSVSWHMPGGSVTQLSTAGVHTHAKGRGSDLQELRLRQKLAPASHPHSNRRTGMEVMAPLPAREGVSLPTMARGHRHQSKGFL